MVRILGIGDCMCDRNMTTGIMYPGGQALNVAVHARLIGEQAGMMGCFGNDEVAAHILRTLDLLGVDRSHSRNYPVPSHTAFYVVEGNERIFIDPPRRPHPMSEVLYDMLAYEGFTEDDWKYISGFDVVHCSNDSRIEQYFPEFKRRGIRLSFDFSVFYERGGYMEQVCPYADFALFSCSGKSERETQAILEKANKLGTSISVGTRGNAGALCFDGVNIYKQPAIDCPGIVDTMGAGDAFISAFLVGFLRTAKAGEPLSGTFQELMRNAAEYAANACLTEGSFGYGIPFDIGSFCTEQKTGGKKRC